MNLKFIINLKPEVSYKYALFENLKFSFKNITHENPKFFHAKLTNTCLLEPVCSTPM